jgi:agmatine deiminase
MISNSKLLMFVLMLFFMACSDHTSDNIEQVENNYYTPGLDNRVAAEWEPALGTMITWPLSVPHTLVIELAKDGQLYTLLENEAIKKEALQWYLTWGIDTTKTTFIYAPQGIDTWWVRDWGPSAVFTKGGEMKLGDGKYRYATPVTTQDCDAELRFIYKTPDNEIITTEVDDNATVPLAEGLNVPVLDLPFVNTGGNVLVDGLGTAFSTCILLNENDYMGVSKDEFLQLNNDLLGLNQYNIISNFEKEGIQHIDCFMKILDEERILVAEPPKDHELYGIYEDIIKNELSKLRSFYGRPYEILRLKTEPYIWDELAAYTNSIIINKTIYVPLFKIEQDSLALKRWREVMPGYTVKGFEFELKNEPTMSQEMKSHYHAYGWNSGDALHCRTRAVWDPEMTFISTKTIAKEVSTTDKNMVYTTIIDYSQKGLVSDSTLLFWKHTGRSDWNVIPFIKENESHFFAEIPFHESETTVEYYVSAVSKSGKRETQPRTAPLGTFSFKIK